MVSLDKKKVSKKQDMKSPKSVPMKAKNKSPMKAKNKSPMKHVKNGKKHQSPAKQEKNGKKHTPAKQEKNGKKHTPAKQEKTDKKQTPKEKKSKPAQQKEQTAENTPKKSHQKNKKRKREDESTVEPEAKKAKQRKAADPEATGFFARLTLTTKPPAVKTYFSKFGDVVYVKILGSRGCGFVGFSNKDSLQQALKTEEHEIDGSTIVFRAAQDGKKTANRENEILVRNLPGGSTVEDLKEHFGQFGKVVSAFIPIRRGKPLPYGFVSFVKSKSMVAALKNETHTFKKAEVKCVKAEGKSKQEKPAAAKVEKSKVTEGKKSKKQKVVVEEPEVEEEEEDDDEEMEADDEEEEEDDDDEEEEEEDDDDDDDEEEEDDDDDDDEE